MLLYATILRMAINLHLFCRIWSSHFRPMAFLFRNADWFLYKTDIRIRNTNTVTERVYFKIQPVTIYILANFYIRPKLNDRRNKASTMSKSC